MDEIINNLQDGEILYTTRKGIQYSLIRVQPNNSIVYSINASQKVLPIQTINAGADAAMNGTQINAFWYKGYDEHEYNTRPCNLKVLQSLINKLLN